MSFSNFVFPVFIILSVSLPFSVAHLKPARVKAIDSIDHCGTIHPIVNMVAAMGMHVQCGKDVSIYINRCCYQHDRCYDEQLQREFCDLSFCGCMAQFSQHSKSCKYLTDNYCGLVKDLGFISYFG